MTRVQQKPHSGRGRDVLVFFGLCIAALAAAILWVAVHNRDRENGQTAALTQHTAALTQRISTLAHQVGGLQTELGRLQTSTAAVQRESAQRLDALRSDVAKLRAQKPPAVRRCLGEVQSEIDDLRAFLAYGSGIRRRVTADCTSVLKPRFGG